MDELLNFLKKGETVKTELGLFCVENLPGYEGNNPKTGQPFSIPGKILPIFLPSDTFLKEVINSDFLTSDEIWHQMGKKIPFPTPTKTLVIGETYKQLVQQLKQEGEAVLPNWVNLLSVK